jgi:Tol biopolymer transport system component
LAWSLVLLLAACGQEPVVPDAAAPSSGARVFYQEATWAPDGASLLLSRHEDGRFRIYRVGADGADLTPLTDGPDSWTSWSPDGSRFVFHSERDGNGEIYVADANGSGQRPITTTASDETTPAWSPDGTRIAFVSERDGEAQLGVMEADGGATRQLEIVEGEPHNPSWSPDGERIVFFTTVGEDDWIETIRSDGTSHHRVARGIFPDWSPVGDRILYTRDHTIYTAAPDGEDERILVEDGFAGRWSPDGREVAFIRGRWPSSEVWVTSADGTGTHLLTR